MASPWTVSQAKDTAATNYIVADGNFQMIGLNNPCVGCYDTTSQTKGGGYFRWLNVDIPQGATITGAYFSVRSLGNYATTTVNSYIQGDAEDNPTSPWDGSNAQYRARRGTVVGGADNSYLTTAKVAWDNIAAFTAGTWYDSPEIKTIIQEIVNRVGWASGNALLLWWDDAEGRGDQVTGDYRFIYSYNNDAASATKLYVTYTTGGSLDPMQAIVDWNAILNSQITLQK